MRERLKAIRVVSRGRGWLAVDKPPGVLSVPGKGEAGELSVVSWLMEHEPRAGGPITVHRLDMDTSGLLLVALNAPTQRALSMQFEARTVDKSYTAVVSGRLTPDTGVFDAPMRLDVPNRPRQVIDFQQGKQAVTNYRVLSAAPGRARVELVPVTGRTHQIRVHLEAIGHSVAGDPVYGTGTSRRGPDGLARLFLHAWRLELTSPSSGSLIRAEAPLPGELEAVLARLRVTTA